MLFSVFVNLFYDMLGTNDSRKRKLATIFFRKTRGGYSKLTTSLINVSLIFQTLISEIPKYLLLKKCEKLLPCKKLHSFFFTKNIIVFGIKVVKHLTS